MSLLSPEDSRHLQPPLQPAVSNRQAEENALDQILLWLKGLSEKGAPSFGEETRGGLIALAVWLLETNRPRASVLVFQAALRQRPDDLKLLKGLAVAAESCGDVKTAHTHWKRLVELTPHDLENQFLWAQSNWRVGERIEAVEMMQTILKLASEAHSLPEHLAVWTQTWRNWLAHPANRH